MCRSPEDMRPAKWSSVDPCGGFDLAVVVVVGLSSGHMKKLTIRTQVDGDCDMRVIKSRAAIA
jgi:hypothetical protein